MKQTNVQIGHIPALLWGETSERWILAVHGNLSHKSDTVIALLAEHATARGHQVLSFDLPEHGARLGESIPFKAQVCVEELQLVMQYAKTQASHLRLFACSFGAYVSLLAYREEALEQAFFLSPVIDMARIIQTMMGWFSIDEAQLQAAQVLKTPAGQTLYWDDYCFVLKHPIDSWPVPTGILYGADDALCEQQIVSAFSQRFDCRLTVLDQGEHFFHTPKQLAFYEAWLEAQL